MSFQKNDLKLKFEQLTLLKSFLNFGQSEPRCSYKKACKIDGLSFARRSRSNPLDADKNGIRATEFRSTEESSNLINFGRPEM